MSDSKDTRALIAAQIFTELLRVRLQANATAFFASNEKVLDYLQPQLEQAKMLAKKIYDDQS